MPTIEELLAKLVSLNGPCPEICDGTIPLGGPNGTSIIDIETGKPVTPYPVIEPPATIPTALILTFDDIANVDPIIGDSTNVSDWNTYFDLPMYGNEFTSVEVDGNEVRLFGGSNIVIKEMLFDQSDQLGTYLLEVNDTAGCVIEVEYDAFGQDNWYGCPNLVSVNFPNVTILGERSFYGCESLITIDLPLVTTVGNDCFDTCGLLTTISLPQAITIGNGAFYNCSLLTTVNFPLVTTLGFTTFSSCPLLTTVNIPSVVTIGDSCFLGCELITTLILPQLQTAGTNAFNRCYALTSINFPQATTLGAQSLLLCTSLTSINLSSCTDLGGTTGNDNVFDGIIGNTITATFNSALATCDGGNPDGDIQYLDLNNTVTITYV